MTQNQISYQANKIKEEEARTNRDKAEYDREIRQKQLALDELLRKSQHLVEYGKIRIPNDKAYQQSAGGQFGMGTKYVDSQTGAAKNIGSAFKDIFTALVPMSKLIG